MKKIEVCVPLECVEPLRAELAGAGILTPTGVTLSCGLLRVGEVRPLDLKARKSRKQTHCKVELVVSDRLAPQAVRFIGGLLHARKGDAPLSHLTLLEVESSYLFEPGFEAPQPSRPERCTRKREASTTPLKAALTQQGLCTLLAA
jgi:hypothetical protein